jgi:hypothetical protein
MLRLSVLVALELRPCRHHKDNLRQDLLYWHHDVPWMCHLGIQRTLKMVSTQLCWPNMEFDISEYVTSCVPCQTNKVDRTRRVPSLSPVVPPSSCWRTLGVDLIVDLARSDGGYNALCVFMCHLSKMVRLVDTNCNTQLITTEFAKLFIREVFPHYGFPLSMVSDRGTQWNSVRVQTQSESNHDMISEDMSLWLQLFLAVPFLGVCVISEDMSHE